MDGKLTYVYLPVSDMDAARKFYRDELGFEESWREGEDTCAFQIPGTTVQLMLDKGESPAGLVFTIPSVERFFEERQSRINFTRQPADIPGNGRWVPAKDVSGNGVYFADIE
jgi:catechol 2,3-dioxygenase-like lactoylglutathione lyase family enzyme